ncbi:formate--tetrahydrofolate ligase [Singulisphaera acidiphila]|uniref:Formate--tetrahydrofolate ligase n=1 Tax=Singulisphaera acidiphila (strain ATCC BAA-1392 / DSM 18658 / VKM B-2454 / MOB10) TaxID=886293 RepID=L0DKQ8_SINAD|nr:formate--tetrahydrofolate ligase [Singulisphaera acidiphila]AGA29959.1 formyltetrahydrofolate synthetase [Singulisphaera acidiphila DSM 18658]
MANTQAELRPIADVARDLGIAKEHLEPYGSDKAKIQLEALATAERPPGKLILVSAITPTPAGEGKTTVSIGLAQGLRKLGRRSALALRQPSMGPVFGRKGGATGGGASRLEPSNKINLQFTGDFHAITAAHNLLAAAIDNRLHFEDSILDPRSVLWKRALDVNDRSLRRVIIGLGGSGNGVPRESGFDITAASEIMAILCLADSPADLRARLNRILIGYTTEGRPVLAGEMGVTGSLAAILNEAILPNLVQSREGTPAFVHGGPFANIAHGCNSILATRMALAFADYAVTEAGFAFDLGGEKFFDLKCRAGGLNPSAIVIVATIRALKMHGGLALDALTTPDPSAVERGLENLAAHLDSAVHFGKPTVVAINQFAADTPDELEVVHSYCRSRQVASSTANVFGAGGDGAKDLARIVVEATKAPPTPYQPLYPLEWSAEQKIERIAKVMYGADGVNILPGAAAKFRKARKLGYGSLPLCMAKTQDSLSDNPKLRGRPKGFTLTVRDVEIAAGAGFLVALTGDIVRMPGLPERPAAERIDVDSASQITGLS